MKPEILSDLNTFINIVDCLDSGMPEWQLKPRLHAARLLSNHLKIKYQLQNDKLHERKKTPDYNFNAYSEKYKR